MGEIMSGDIGEDEKINGKRKMETVKTYARQRKISPSLVYKQIKLGRIPAYRFNSAIRIVAEEADECVRAESERKRREALQREEDRKARTRTTLSSDAPAA
jgi:hypothetical protein